jgi:hypothetical protein
MAKFKQYNLDELADTPILEPEIIQPTIKKSGLRRFNFDELSDTPIEPIEQAGIERGFVGDIASSIARGVPVLGELTGQALKTLDPSGILLKPIGEKIIRGAEKLRELDIMKPDISEAAGEGFIKRGVKGGLESAVPSLAPAIAGGVPGAKAGAVIGTAILPGPGTAVGATIGGLLGGTLATLAVHGLGTYGQRKEEYLNRGIDEKIAHKAATQQALVEGGIESISNIAGMMTFGFGKIATQPLKNTAKELLKTPFKTFAKNLTKNAALNEVPTEILQGALGAKIDERIGVLPEGAWQMAAVESIIPALTMSVLFGVGAQTITSVQRNNIKNKLNSEDQVERIQAAQFISSNIKDKELKKAWSDMTESLIEAGSPIDINADFTKPGEVQAAQPLSEQDTAILDTIDSGLKDKSLTLEEALELKADERFTHLSDNIDNIIGEFQAKQTPSDLSESHRELAKEAIVEKIDQLGIESEQFEEFLAAEVVDVEPEITKEQKAVSDKIETGEFIPAETLKKFPGLIPEDQILEEKPEPEIEPQEKAAEQINKDIPGQDIKSDGSQDLPTGKTIYSFTPQSGPLKGRTFSSFSLDPKEIKESFNKLEPTTETKKAPKVEPEKVPTETQKGLKIEEFEGKTGQRSHTTRIETGTIPVISISHLEGESGEIRGEHRNKKGKEWEKFKADILKNGIKEEILILKDPGKPAVVSEGNHRLDAAIELGIKDIPVDIRYFGNSQNEGLAYKESLKLDKDTSQPKSWFKLGEVVNFEYTDKTGNSTTLRPNKKLLKEAAKRLGISVVDAERALSVYNSSDPIQDERQFKDKKIPAVKEISLTKPDKITTEIKPEDAIAKAKEEISLIKRYPTLSEDPEQEIAEFQNVIDENEALLKEKKEPKDILTDAPIPKGSIQTGKSVKYHYTHSIEPAPDRGKEFAQDIEPSGKYIAPSSEKLPKLKGLEKGIVEFKNPLVLEHKTTRHGGWKTDLSNMYDGKTGTELTEAILNDGHDGIITLDGDRISEGVILEKEEPKPKIIEAPFKIGDTIHTMPDGSIMPGPEHAEAVKGSERKATKEDVEGVKIEEVPIKELRPIVEDNLDLVELGSFDRIKKIRERFPDLTASKQLRLGIKIKEEATGQIGARREKEEAESIRQIAEEDRLLRQQRGLPPEKKQPKKPGNIIDFKESDVPRQTAERAYAGISFSPDKRADQLQAGYVEHMQNVHDSFINKIKPEQKELLISELEKYKQGYLRKYIAWMDALGRTISPMITGPSNFPVSSNKKKQNTERRRSDELSIFDKKAQKAINKKLGLSTSAISSDDPQAIQRLKEKLETLEANHQKMKDANQIIRNKKTSDDDKIKSLTEIGFSQEESKELLSPDFTGRKGFASFSLTNNNANIKRTKGRIKELEKRAGDITESIQVGDIEIIDNVEDNRVQIVFDGKPSEEIRKKLKANGFRWSPKKQVWQRQRNTNVVALAKRLVADETKPPTSIREALGKANTKITAEDGRAYILEDLVTGIYKAGMSIKEFTGKVADKLGKAYDKVKDAVVKMYHAINTHLETFTLGAEVGAITLGKEPKKQTPAERILEKAAALRNKPVTDPEVISLAESSEPISINDYEKNREESGNVKIAATTSIKRVGGEIAKGIDKFLGSISTRLGNINPKLKSKIRKLSFDTDLKSTKDVQKVEPLLKKAKSKMTKADFADWDYARKNSDVEKLNELIEKYDIREEYDAYRDSLDSLRDEGLDVGLDIGYIEDYAPRVLKDSRGFLKAIGKEGDWPVISRRLQERAGVMGITVAEMPEDQKADLISSMLYGGNYGLGGVPATKERKLKKIPAKLNKFYMDSDGALMAHIYSMRKGIETRKFFGKVPEKISTAKRRLNLVNKKIIELKKENASPERIKFHEDNKFAFQEIINKYKNQRDYTDNINSYVIDLIQQGEINAAQEQELIDILTARFNEKGTRGVVQAYKNLSYIDTMGSITSALTQIGDLAWAAYEGGLPKALKNAYKSATGKSRITKEGVGINRIAQEFQDSGALGDAVSKVFKIVGLEKMDSIGKESLLNSALEKFQEQAKNNPNKLRNNIRHIFEGETDQVVDDLLNDEITDNVKLLVYNRLLDFQPVALSEMPQKYLEAGNGRIFYMLKTFTIKQFDAFRNEAYNKIKSSDPKEKIQGVKNLVRLAMFFVLANAGADELKDFVLGRKTDFDDRIVDNMLRLFGVSKFVTWKARTEGLGSAMARQMLPPFKFLDAATKDIVKAGDGKGLETLASVPVVGKLAYWHMGRGTSKRSDLWDRRLSKRKKKLNIIKDDLEKSKDKRAFRSKHKKQLFELKKLNRLQGRLNSKRKRINQLKSRKESEKIKQRIMKLEKARTKLIKDYFDKN